MANATDSRAVQVHGGNPQSLIDQIVRNRIYSNIYWKEKLAGVNAEDLVDRAVELKYIGGTYGGNRKPSKFLCLVLKLLQIQPDKKVIYTLIDNSHYKYVRALGLFYLRLVGSSSEVYAACEKVLTDYRPLVVRHHDGSFSVIHVDELADSLLRLDICYDVVLPRLVKRDVLEDQGKIGPKVSVIEAALEDADEDGEAQDGSQDLKDSKASGESEDRERSRSKSKKKDRKEKKDKKKRSRSRDEDSEERRQRKKDRKLKKLLKKAKKEKKAKEKEKAMEEDAKRKETADYWAKLRAEQGLKAAGS